MPNNNSSIKLKFKNGELIFHKINNGLYPDQILLDLINNIKEITEDITYTTEPKLISADILNVLKSKKRAQYLIEYAQALENILKFETDIITMRLIKELYNIEPNAENIFAYMLNLIYNDAKPTSKNDINNSRIRFAELFAQVIYKELSASYEKYKKDKQSSTSKETSLSKYFNKDTIMNKMFESTAYGYRLPELLQLLETSSPIEEQSTYYTIKFGGPDGLKADQQIMDIAVLHPSAFGVISAYDTPENNNTSRTNRLTLGAYIQTRYGKIAKIEPNNYSILSPVEALIPFIEHNDGNRVLLATNQLRSVVPVYNPELPIIMTGGEEIFSHLTTGLFIKRAKKSGKVIKRTNEFMVIEYEDGEKEFIDTTYAVLKTGKGTYLIHYNPIKKDEFNENEILLYSDYFDYNTLKTGINTTVAFLHYPGLTYEDGIVVSETFAKKLGITKKVHVLTIPIFDNEKILQIINKEGMIKNGSILLRIERQMKLDNTKEDIIIDDIKEDDNDEFDISDDENDLLEAETIGKIKNIRGKRGKLISIEIYSNTKNIDDILKPIYNNFIIRHQEYVKAYQEHQPLIEPKYLLPDNKGKYRYKDKIPKYIIRFVIETYSAAKLGDKLCNRHGNKGVISKILPDELMPKTEQGETIHVILDPMGVINRMNIGQVLEASLSYLAKHAYLKKVKDFESFKKVYKKFMSILYKADPDFIHKFNNALTDNDYKILFEKAKKIQALPIYIIPFKSPFKNKNLHIIKELEDFVGVHVEQKLYLPEFNTYTFDKIQIGYMYMFRLEHVTDEVLHTRYLGKRKGLTSQATKGKKVGGGYRLGEFDTWQLIANDVPNVAKELFYLNSEAQEFEDIVIKDIIDKGTANLPEKFTLRSTKLIDIIKHALFIK